MATSIASPARGARSSAADQAFLWLLRGLAALVPVLIVGIGFELYRASALSRHAFGWHFLAASTWDPITEQYGAWPFIFGTLFTTALALVIAAPLGVAVAIFLAELAPRWLRGPLSNIVDLLAAVPSIVFGLWGFLVMVPFLQETVEPWLGDHFGKLPLFQGAPYGVGFLAAGLVLAMMVIPFVIGVSREVIGAVPVAQREAAYALAATRWDAIWDVVLPSARSGIWGGILLAMGRALGETMAVTMVIGNRPAVSTSLFAPGYTLASVIANEFSEATTPTYIAALLEIGLVLFGITLLVNVIARVFIWRMTRQVERVAA